MLSACGLLTHGGQSFAEAFTDPALQEDIGRRPRSTQKTNDASVRYCAVVSRVLKLNEVVPVGIDERLRTYKIVKRELKVDDNVTGTGDLCSAARRGCRRTGCSAYRRAAWHRWSLAWQKIAAYRHATQHTVFKKFG